MYLNLFLFHYETSGLTGGFACCGLSPPLTVAFYIHLGTWKSTETRISILILANFLRSLTNGLEDDFSSPSTLIVSRSRTLQRQPRTSRTRTCLSRGASGTNSRLDEAYGTTFEHGGELDTGYP